MTTQSQLCSVEELKSLIKQDDVVILDSSWYLPSQRIDAHKEFAGQHIPGARFFAIDKICDQESRLPHMLPNATQFSEAVSELGVSKDSRIVVYDSAGLFSAARVWWTFKVFGHDKVQVLDGGLPRWVEQGGDLDSLATLDCSLNEATKRSYVAKLNSAMVADKAALIENSSSKQYVVLDARPKERFLGKAPEPRPELPSGHMPESISVSASSLIDRGRLKPKNELQKLFNEIHIDQTTLIVTSCGSGVTAAIITLALAECGYGLNKLYDGAWSEWAAADDTIVLNRSL